MWFRRDLRVADNPALLEALRSADEVVPLFVHDERLRRPAGAPRLAFLRRCLAALDDELDGHLVCRNGDPSAAVPAVAAEVGAHAVYCAEDFGPYGVARDEAVEQALVGDGRELRRVGSSYAIPPGTLFTGQGGSFRVFTPFSRAWHAHGWDDPHSRPSRPRWTSALASDPEPEAPTVELPLPEPGERAAQRRVDAFLAGPVDAYDRRRNDPAADATSRLSPYLKWGCIHPRQLLGALGEGRGPATFAKELAWRDFYADVLFHRPDTVHRHFDQKMEGLRSDTGSTADERLEAWVEGRTGFPIVDAGMRQLAGEAWMHNRVRMIVASFLTKDLHLPWQRGARVFHDRLVDADIASNSHGWQWVAGTGTDPSPYVRVFNPVSQGKRFDPDGDYVRRWVPELRSIEGAAVHEPWKVASGMFGPPELDGYPAPIVDHAAERAEALERYRAR